MTPRPIALRATAARDIDGSTDFYLSEGGVQVALGFIEALQQAFELLGEQPGAGAQRYAHELGIPGPASVADAPLSALGVLRGAR